MRKVFVIVWMLVGAVALALEKQPLPPEVNEGESTFAPVLTHDGRALYFCKRVNVGLPDEPVWTEDIYRSERTADGWTKAVRIDELSTRDQNEGVMWVSDDEQMMLVFRNGKCCFTQRTAKGWGPLYLLPDVINGLSYWVADVRITPDGSALLMAASTRLPGQPQDNRNLYVSLRQPDGSWGTPQSLGPVVNSASHERAPILHTDLHTLYFTSDGHGSMGGYDLFRCTRLSDNSWTEWSEPVNMGPEVNTVDEESWYDVAADGSIGLISSGPRYKEHIYSFGLPPLPEEPVAVVAVDTLEQVLRSGGEWTLRSVLFAVNRSEIVPESAAELDKIAAVLRDRKNHVLIAGHADNSGTPEANQRLSQERAEAVRTYLISKGCRADLLVARGYGDTQPVADNSTDEGRRLNRRVTVRQLP